MSLPLKIAARTAGDTVSTDGNCSDGIPEDEVVAVVGIDRKLQSDARSDVPDERSKRACTMRCRSMRFGRPG